MVRAFTFEPAYFSSASSKLSLLVNTPKIASANPLVRFEVSILSIFCLMSVAPNSSIVLAITRVTIGPILREESWLSLADITVARDDFPSIKSIPVITERASINSGGTARKTLRKLP